MNRTGHRVVLALIAVGSAPVACTIHSEVGHLPGQGGAGVDGGVMPGTAGADAATPSPDGPSPGDALPPPTTNNGGGGGGAVLAACTPDIGTRIPPGPLRGLDNFEYRNTLRDLAQVDVSETDLPVDGWPGLSEDEALARSVDAYHAVGHRFALDATKSAATVAGITGCDVAAAGETACAQKLLDGFVARLLRRPLAADGVTDFQAVFAQGRQLGGDFPSGVRAVLEVALQSPELLYRVELGEAADPAQPRLARPRAFEMAARLSYLLWASAPDDLLRQAAAQNALQTKAQVVAQAQRMLADNRAHEVARRFYLRLLDVPSVPTGPLAALQTSFLQETSLFLDDVLWTGAGDLKTVLSAPYSYLDGTAAMAYGVGGVTGAGFRKVALPAAQRRGLLTQGSFLAARPSTSLRGLRIHQDLLCGQVEDGDPTPDAQRSAWPPQDPSQSHRGYIEQLTAPAGCQSCHGQFDPIGFAFGHYDNRGAWMDGEPQVGGGGGGGGGTIAIDAHGAIAGTDAAGSFDGALALIDRLAASRDVRNCHVQKWMEVAYGRQVVAADACSQAVLQSAFAASGGNIADLMVTLTQTEAFLYRPTP